MQVGTFQLPVVNLPSDGQSLFMVLNGLDGLLLVQGAVGDAQVAQVGTFPPPVANLPVDGQSLLMVLDGLFHLAKKVVI